MAIALLKLTNSDGEPFYVDFDSVEAVGPNVAPLDGMAFVQVGGRVWHSDHSVDEIVDAISPAIIIEVDSD